MNVKRFVARSAREALSQARAAWGDNAVVLSNREVPGGVEIVAMPHAQAAVASASLPEPVLADAPGASDPPPAAASRRQAAPLPETPMSTLSFEQFVRERQRRQAPRVPLEPGRFAAEELQRAADDAMARAPAATPVAAAVPVAQLPPVLALADAVTLPVASAPAPAVAAPAATQRVLDELREMRTSLGGQLARLAWFDDARRKPAHTRLLRALLDAGFTPALARYLVDKLPPAGDGDGDGDDEAASRWLSQVLQRNLRCAQGLGEPLALRGGTLALVGPGGAGKTFACAALAQAHAAFFSPAAVGVIAFEPGPERGGEPLRAVARSLGVVVHTARDREALVDLLGLLAGRSLVLVDMPGVTASDPRRQELDACLPPALERLLVLPATLQPESLDETVQAWARSGTSGASAGCVFTRMDEAHRIGPVIDLAVRRKLRVEGLVQRVGEAAVWGQPDAASLVGRALASAANPLFALADEDLGLLMTPSPSLSPDRAD